MATSSEIANSTYDAANGAQKSTLATGLAQSSDSVLTHPRGGNSTVLTASGLVNTGACKLIDIFVSAASGTPTIKVWDNTAQSGTVLIDTFTPTAGQTYQFNYRRASTGLYVTIGGTVTCSVNYDPTTT